MRGDVRLWLLRLDEYLSSGRRGHRVRYGRRQLHRLHDADARRDVRQRRVFGGELVEQQLGWVVERRWLLAVVMPDLRLYYWSHHTLLHDGRSLRLLPLWHMQLTPRLR
jgi:hypothetical protein